MKIEKKRKKKRDLLIEKKKCERMNFQREESIPIFVSITYEIVFSGGGEEAFAGRELKTSQAELNEKSRRKNRTGEMEGIIFFPCVFFFFC